MSILVYRDTPEGKTFVGSIAYDSTSESAFHYDRRYLFAAEDAGELGISERIPLDSEPYGPEEITPFFEGLLPEGEVMSELARMYQLPRNDYLAFLEQLGCESVGALTFESERINAGEYVANYTPLERWAAESLAVAPVRATAQMVSEMRLSLPGAQTKVAWSLPETISAQEASLGDWLVPRGTAPSTHIIKISRRGEEDLACNELACSILARACGIDVAEITPVQSLPGAIAVKRYDRIWIGEEGERRVLRLHQEDFCQALGFPSHLKYQPDGIDRSYMRIVADLLDSVSDNPIIDKREFAMRLVFNFIVGNADAHLKNSALLYDQRWTGRTLAPLYGAACLPLTGYSTKMAFDIGKHRYLQDIDEQDLAAIPRELDIPQPAFKSGAETIVSALEAFGDRELSADVAAMVKRILDNAQPRVAVVKRYLG